MIKLIHQSDYKKSIWKNGQGTSEEIYILPRSSKFPTEPFVFRISMAEIKGNNEFSLFPNYQRVLTVIAGIGILLNETPLRTHEIIHFPGTENIVSRPLSSNTVVDLGVIYDEKKVNVGMTLLKSGDQKIELDRQKIYFLVCSNGQLEFNGSILKPFETAHIFEEDVLTLKSFECAAFLITVTFQS